MLNVLLLQDADIATVCAELQKKRDEAPQFFMQSPLVVDCSELEDEIVTTIDFGALKNALLELGFIPVGVRNAPAEMTASLAESGWAVMRASTRPVTQEASPSADKQASTEAPDASESQPESAQQAPVETLVAPAPRAAITIERPVRSGQQVYAAEADMTVLAPTSAGSEVMADGSIHVYAALRGRVLAGARGNESARIFCRSLQAELIAIAGRYQLLDDLDPSLIGKPAMIRLEGEKLIIEPLV